jgi:uracil-DNA glycosylase
MTDQVALWPDPAVSAPAATPRLTAWRPVAWPVAGDWQALTTDFFNSDAGRRLGTFVQARLDAGAVVYPAQPLRALELTALADVRVVILGQDPYHGPGQAEGLAFSVAGGQKIPPSLRNIFKELRRDLGVPVAGDGSLVRWAKQGVLLLNTSLTVEDGHPGSHAEKGWEGLTNAIIDAVSRLERPVVFMLWGAHAQRKAALIDASPQRHQHRVLVANHPSPLSASRPPVPFLGCGHFHEANRFLARSRVAPLRW